MEDKLRLLDKVVAGDLVMERGTQRVLVRELRDYKATSERVQKVLDRGWEPFTRPAHGTLGYLEIPHKWGAWSLVLGFLVLLLVGAIISTVFASLSFRPATVPFNLSMVLGTLTAAGLAATALVVGIHCVQTKGRSADWPSQWYRDYVDFHALAGVVHLYAGATPVKAWQKYQRDKGLFDEVYIWSKDTSLFRTVRASPRVAIGDPILVGRIGSGLYMGAQWDLKAEIALGNSALSSQAPHTAK